MIKYSLHGVIHRHALTLKTKAESRRRIGLMGQFVKQEAQKLLNKSGARRGKGGRFEKNTKGSVAPAPPFTKTGNLKNSIKWEFGEGLTARVGPTVLYGKFLEFGTRKMAARPFMRPALAIAVKVFPKFFKGLI